VPYLSYSAVVIHYEEALYQDLRRKHSLRPVTRSSTNMTLLLLGCSMPAMQRQERHGHQELIAALTGQQMPLRSELPPS